jgi:hypothetical protein
MQRYDYNPTSLGKSTGYAEYTKDDHLTSEQNALNQAMLDYDAVIGDCECDDPNSVCSCGSYERAAAIIAQRLTASQTSEAKPKQAQLLSASKPRQVEPEVEMERAFLACGGSSPLPAFPAESVTQYIIDSGAARHLVSFSPHLKTFKGETVEFSTANGVIRSTLRAKIHIKGLKGSFIACVLPSTPCVLSLGQLIEDGFGFNWLHGCEPQLLLPGGDSFVGLSVCENVPYIPTVVSPLPFASSAVALPADMKLVITNAVPAVPEAAEIEPPAEVIPPPEQAKRQFTNKEHHNLTHFPSQLGCKICQQAKQKRAPARAARPNEVHKVCTSFGECVHIDHIGQALLIHATVHAEQCSLQVHDQATSFRASYPAASRSESSVETALRHFAGKQLDQIRCVRSDNAPEYVSLFADTFKDIVHERSIPHAHETHAIRERMNQEDISGVRSLLLQSGLDHGWWGYAAVAFDHCYNVVTVDQNNVSVYELRHEQPAKHKPLAFGCLVTVKPTVKECDKRGKFMPSGLECVYLGAFLGPGGIPDGSAYCVELAQLGSSYEGYLKIRRTRDYKQVGSGPMFPIAEANAHKLLLDLAGGVQPGQAVVDNGDVDDVGIVDVEGGAIAPQLQQQQTLTTYEQCIVHGSETTVTHLICGADECFVVDMADCSCQRSEHVRSKHHNRQKHFLHEVSNVLYDLDRDGQLRLCHQGQSSGPGLRFM